MFLEAFFVDKNVDNFSVRDTRRGNWLWIEKPTLDLIHEKIGKSGVVVYTYLCYYANNSTQKCYTSIRVLSQRTNLSVRHVRRILRKLEELNAIKTTTYKGRKTNTYMLVSYLDLADKQVNVSGQIGHSYVRSDRTFEKRKSLPPNTPTIGQDLSFQDLSEQEKETRKSSGETKTKNVSPVLFNRSLQDSQNLNPTLPPKFQKLLAKEKQKELQFRDQIKLKWQEKFKEPIADSQISLLLGNAKRKIYGFKFCEALLAWINSVNGEGKTEPFGYAKRVAEHEAGVTPYIKEARMKCKDEKSLIGAILSET